jgi:hypothetical protein
MDQTLGDSTQNRGNSWADLESEIVAVGSANPLKNLLLDPYAQIDLERAHPGGLAQFITSKPTLLSNLVRDPLAFSKSLAAAKRIKAKGERLDDHFGLNSLFLAGGLFDLSGDGRDLRLPILLWPIRLLARGADDFEVTLAGSPQVNAELVQVLAANYGIALNPNELLYRQAQSTDLVPLDLMNYLATVCASASVDIRRVLVIANFAPTLSVFKSEAAKISRAEQVATRTALAKLLDNEASEEGKTSRGSLLESAAIPEAFLVADADVTQRAIVSKALAGQCFAVETLPGSGYTQTVVNTIAALVNSGKKVVVSAPRRQTLNELSDRFAQLRLNGLALRATETWPDAIAAISRNEKAANLSLNPSRGELSERLDASVAAIEDYFETLEAVDAKLGVSANQALIKLSELSALSRAPETKARIELDKLDSLADRSEAVELLSKLADLDYFKFGPQDTSWFGSTFGSAEDLAAVRSLVARVINESFPKLYDQLTEFTERTKFKPAKSVEDWGAYLKLFVGVRETLDRFQPLVFDRALTELIIATGPRRPDPADFDDPSVNLKMSGGNRRRLKKLAKEYLRPGMSVTDMSAALRTIEKQRSQWIEFSTVPSPPQVPLGIADVQVAYQSLIRDLEAIQAHLDPERNKASLVKLPLENLRQLLAELAAPTDFFDTYADRELIAAELRSLGLGRLITDLAALHAPKEHLAAELEQAWWQTALELLVSKNPKILTYSSKRISELEHEFKEADAAVVSAGMTSLSIELAERWRSALGAHPEQAAALKAVLRSGHASAIELATAAPEIWPSLAPAIMVSPFEFTELVPNQQNFDVALILDAAGASVADHAAVLSRAKQVIAFGDEAIAAAVPFEVVPRPNLHDAPQRTHSVYQAASARFETVSMVKSWRTTGQTTGTLVNREFYDGRIVFEPTAAEFLGESALDLVVVHQENRATSNVEGATESVDGEVAKVLELVVHHAKWHPEDSLLVASASQVHAERIRAAIASSLSKQAELATFFDAHGRERFEVSSLADLTHRIADRVIFSVGFGRTPHGAVLSNFGQLQSASGRRYLANLLVSARKSLTVVSCFEAQDLPVDKLQNGAALLSDLLAAASGGNADLQDHERDPMLIDLGVRLQKLGIRVSGSFAKRLPLVASYAKSALVVEPDWALNGETWSEKLRLRPALLEAMGWHYFRVHSFELFADPQAVAERIAERLGVALGRQVEGQAATRVFEDTDAAWGDRGETSSQAGPNDRRLREDKPPHWG